jgi:hypothetical protein
MSSSAAASAERVLSKHGFATLVALGLTWWLAMVATKTLWQMSATLQGHVIESSFYQHQICLNTATTPLAAAACTPPQGH